MTTANPAGAAPVSMKKNPKNPATEWPTDPDELLTYYQGLMKSSDEIMAEIQKLTGATDVGWRQGKGMQNNPSVLNPTQRSRLQMLQYQQQQMTEERTSLEGVLPGILNMRKNPLDRVPEAPPANANKSLWDRVTGNDPLASQRAAIERERQQAAALQAAMPGMLERDMRMTGFQDLTQQGQMPMGREMIQEEWGPVTDAEYTAIRNRNLGIPDPTDPNQGAITPYQQAQMAFQQQQLEAQIAQQQWERGLTEKELVAQGQARQQALAQQAWSRGFQQQQLAASMAGDVAGIHSANFRAEMPYAVPMGTQYTPGFEPNGPISQMAARAGVPFTPYGVAPVVAPDPYAPYARFGATAQAQYAAPQAPVPQQAAPIDPRYPQPQHRVGYPTW